MNLGIGRRCRSCPPEYRSVEADGREVGPGRPQVGQEWPIEVNGPTRDGERQMSWIDVEKECIQAVQGYARDRAVVGSEVDVEAQVSDGPEPHVVGHERRSFSCCPVLRFGYRSERPSRVYARGRVFEVEASSSPRAGGKKTVGRFD